MRRSGRQRACLTNGSNSSWVDVNEWYAILTTLSRLRTGYVPWYRYSNGAVTADPTQPPDRWSAGEFCCHQKGPTVVEDYARRGVSGIDQVPNRTKG